MIAQLPDLELFYRIDGPVDAPLVCLVHCFGSDHRFWDGQLAALAQYRVLRFDARGHGCSGQPPGPYSLADMAGDLLALLDHLELKNVHLAGASMGGMVAQHVAIHQSQRLASLGLITTTFEYSSAQRAHWQRLGVIAQQQGTVALHDELMQRWFCPASIDNAIAGYRFMSDAFSGFSGDSFAWACEAVRLVDFGNRLHEITVPTVVIASENDPGVPASVSRAMADAIPGAQLRWTPFAHHLASLEHPDMVARTYRQFLDQLS